MIFWNDILKMWWHNLDITDVTLASDDQSIKLTRWSSRLVAPNLKTLVIVYIREKRNFWNQWQSLISTLWKVSPLQGHAWIFSCTHCCPDLQSRASAVLQEYCGSIAGGPRHTTCLQEYHRSITGVLQEYCRSISGVFKEYCRRAWAHSSWLHGCIINCSPWPDNPLLSGPLHRYITPACRTLLTHTKPPTSWPPSSSCSL